MEAGGEVRRKSPEYALGLNALLPAHCVWFAKSCLVVVTGLTGILACMLWVQYAPNLPLLHDVASTV